MDAGALQQRDHGRDQNYIVGANKFAHKVNSYRIMSAAGVLRRARDAKGMRAASPRAAHASRYRALARWRPTGRPSTSGQATARLSVAAAPDRFRNRS